jgi:hypothetical protein
VTSRLGTGKSLTVFLQCSIFDVQYEEYVKGRMSDTTTGFGIELGKNREDFNHTRLMPSTKNYMFMEAAFICF